MMQTEATVATEHGIAYLRRLCRHFSHKIPTSMHGEQGRIEFPFGLCVVDVDEKSMRIRIAIDQASELDRAERVVEDHLLRMANKDDPVVVWHRTID